MTASLLELVLTGALLVVIAGAVAAGVVGYLAWRAVRRRIRAVRSHGLFLGATALWQAASTSRWGRGPGAPTPGELAGGSSAQARRELWRGVDAATAAVRSAQEAGAVVADLPTLCRSLESAAVDLDRVLRIDPASPVPAAEATRVAEVLRAASDIRSAVQAAAGEVAGERVDQLLGDAARELHLLEVGRAALRATGPAAPSLPMGAPPAAPASGGDVPPGLPAPPR